MKRLCTASVMERLDVSSKTTIRKFVKKGLLPKPMNDPGSNVNYWLESQIDEFIQRQAIRQDQPQQAAA